jgi:ABC-type multidrug transport system fused ATPase/permease subunit
LCTYNLTHWSLHRRNLTLLLLNRKEVDVPEDLRAALLGEEVVKHMNDDEEDGAKPVIILHSLLSSRASEIAEMDEDELVKEIRMVHEKLWGQDPRQYECRVVNGSYTVTKVSENDVKFPNVAHIASATLRRSPHGEQEEEESGPQRATQRIETVATASPINKIFGRMARSVYTGGNAMKKETKVIAEGINLRFEAGKMYLILGLPGSGKSTVLKMIADTLTKDDKHVVGGKVIVNGMSPSDKDVVWSVRCFVCLRIMSRRQV